MAERTGRGAFCASSLARRVSRLGGGTERYLVHIFRVVVADRLRTLCRSALERPVRVDCHNSRTGTIGKTHAGDLAFRDVATGLLAVAPFRPYFPQGHGYKTLATAAREAAVVCSGGGLCGCHNTRAVSWRDCAYIPRVSYCAAAVECAGVVC